MRLLYIVSKGMNDPTLASVPLHIAANGSLEVGQDVSVVLAGDATDLVIGDNAQHMEGVGVPPARELLSKAERARGSRVRLKGLRGCPWGDGGERGARQRQMGGPTGCSKARGGGRQGTDLLGTPVRTLEKTPSIRPGKRVQERRHSTSSLGSTRNRPASRIE